MDAADKLTILTLVEDPARWEALVLDQIARGEADVVRSIYCDRDRAAAFGRFRQCAEFGRILRLLRLLGVTEATSICELGGGGGWLSWALGTSGYKDIELLEPNDAFISGTGYLRTRDDARNIRIWNNVETWHSSARRYDLLLTHNCVHHFRGIGHTAAGLRQKLVDGGRWLLIREWYAETPEELYSLIASHPFSQRYGVYEFPYPAAHYIESIEIAGFELEALVPARYANGVLDGSHDDERPGLNAWGTKAFDAVLAHAKGVTRVAYHIEQLANKALGNRFRYFTRPGAMVFRRRRLGPL